MSDEVPKAKVKSEMMAAECAGGEVVPTSTATTTTTQSITTMFSGGVKVLVVQLGKKSFKAVLQPDQNMPSTSTLSKRSSAEIEETDAASSSAKKIKISEAKIVNKEEQSDCDEHSARAFRTEAPATSSKITEKTNDLHTQDQERQRDADKHLARAFRTEAPVGPSKITRKTNDTQPQNQERQSNADEHSACAFRTEATAGPSKFTEKTNVSQPQNQEWQSDADEHSAGAFRTEATAGPSKFTEKTNVSQPQNQEWQSDADEHSARAFRTEALAGPSKDTKRTNDSEEQNKEQQINADACAAHLLLRLTDLAVYIAGASEEYRELLGLEQVIDGPLGDYYNIERRARSRLLVSNFEKRRKLIGNNYAILIAAYQERLIPLLTAEVNKISPVSLTPQEVRKIINMIQDSSVCFTAASESFLRTLRGRNWLQNMLLPGNRSGNNN